MPKVSFARRGMNCSVSSCVQVSLLFSTAVENVMLCGGKFWGHQGQGFALTAYDSDKIVEYSRT